MATYIRNDGFSDVQPAIVAPATPGTEGSRQHYFHFLIGYLIPVVNEQTQRALPRFGVLDCGPLMTGHMVETISRIGWRFDVCENRRIMQPIFVPMWDTGWADAAAPQVQRAVDRVRRAWRSDPACDQPDCPRAHNLVLTRSPATTFYRPGGAAEIATYGRDRRSITNITEIEEHLRRSGVEHDVYEPGRHSLGCQIATFGGAERIVGIRGAEWANMIWATSNVNVTILDPDPPARVLAGFLDRLGLRSEVRVIPDAHAEVDPAIVERALTVPV